MVVLLEGEVAAPAMPWKEVVVPAVPWIVPAFDEAQNHVYLQLLQLFGWLCSKWAVPGEESSHLLSTNRMAAITRRLIGLLIHMQERHVYKERVILQRYQHQMQYCKEPVKFENSGVFYDDECVIQVGAKLTNCAKIRLRLYCCISAESLACIQCFCRGPQTPLSG